MKKSALLAMPKLTATPEMKQAAIADEPKQHENPYGYRYVERTYYPYMNCVVPWMWPGTWGCLNPVYATQ